MLEYTPDTETRPAPVYRADPTAATMAQPAISPAYAWAAEAADSDYPAPARNRSRVLRPVAFAAAGAVAAAVGAAALMVVLSGPAQSTAVSTPNAAVAITATPAKATPAATPTATQAARSTTVSHPQVHHSSYAHTSSSSNSTAAPTHVTASYPTTTVTPVTTDDSTGNGYQNQWRPWHDTTQPSWNWNFFQPHFTSSQRHHHDHDHDSSDSQHSDQSSDN